jgi:uncharacterized protein YbaP (TraB family)
VRGLRKRARAAALALAALMVLLASWPAAATPALWRVEGPSATIYLFGTVHALRKNVFWESPAIARALAASRELWLEIPDPADRQQAQSLALQLGFDPQHPLSATLPPAVLAHLDAAAKAIGLPQGEKALDTMRPWFASVAITDALLIHDGYDPESGVEPLLLHEAVAAGKPVRGFETMAQQIHFFADMPPALELQMLESALQDVDGGTRQVDAMVDAWMSGDETAIARTVVNAVREPFPALYRVLFLARNTAWADTIAHLVQGSGVIFVAVGAGHLAGPDSLQALLRRRGLAVERVE